MHRTAILADELDARFGHQADDAPKRSEAGDPAHPPLACRTSRPQGGRLDVAPAFANFQSCR
ncbi:MAG: hypothetical protein EOS68_26880, partial [Mesorhizobium sp.]